MLWIISIRKIIYWFKTEAGEACLFDSGFQAAGTEISHAWHFHSEKVIFKVVLFRVPLKEKPHQVV